jgi:hypothetical protein
MAPMAPAAPVTRIGLSLCGFHHHIAGLKLRLEVLANGAGCGSRVLARIEVPIWPGMTTEHLMCGALICRSVISVSVKPFTANFRRRAECKETRGTEEDYSGS